MINFTSLSNFSTPFISLAVLVLFFYLLSTVFRRIKDVSCILTQFSSPLTVVQPFLFPFPSICLGLFALHHYIIVTKKLQDERCHHHIFAQNILMPLDCMCCLDRHIVLMMTPSQFFFCISFFFSKNINCTFMDFRLSHLHGFRKKRHGTEDLT